MASRCKSSGFPIGCSPTMAVCRMELRPVRLLSSSRLWRWLRSWSYSAKSCCCREAASGAMVRGSGMASGVGWPNLARNGATALDSSWLTAVILALTSAIR